MKEVILLQSRRLATTSTLLLGIAMILGALSCSPGGYSGKVESITLGTAPLESSALIYTAEDQGFFVDSGLDVTIRDYETGLASLNGLVSGEVDIATPAEYALIGKAFKNEKVSAIASIDKVQYFFIVGRKDRGIEKVSDLKGKKIGVVLKTTAEFYLGRFLEFNILSLEQVTLVNVNYPQSEDALLSGNVDAVVSRPPYINAIEKRLGANGVIWPAQSRQPLYAVIIGRNDWIEGNSEAVKRLLRSLARAEEYVINNPEKARAIVQKRLNFDDDYMATVWSQNQFSLTLDRSLVVAMEDEARWMIGNGLTDEQQVPDFLKFVYPEGIKAVKPGAVNIIR